MVLSASSPTALSESGNSYKYVIKRNGELMISKYGIKIKNFQAGALYQCNLVLLVCFLHFPFFLKNH